MCHVIRPKVVRNPFCFSVRLNIFDEAANELTVTVSEVLIRYISVGEGRPILVLPGFGWNAVQMHRFFDDALSARDGWRRLYVDLPGTGKTLGSPAICSTDAISDLYIAFVEEVIANNDFVVAGYSYGAYLARDVAVSLKERVEGLLMVAPKFATDEEVSDLPEHIAVIVDDDFLASLNCFRVLRSQSLMQPVMVSS